MPSEVFDPEYPLEALAAAPRLLRAIEYAYVETQAPIAMCATSGLAAAAALTHPLVFACWRPGVRTPGSSIFITEADSGERKSEVDRLTFREHRLFEDRQYLLAKEDQAKFDARMTAWTAVQKGLARAVETAVRRQDASEAAIARLEEHEHNKPVQPQRPRVLMTNATPEAVETHLFDIYPCVNAVAKDGGDAFAAGLFDKTSMLNSLWDDGTWESRRVSRGSTVITGASACIYAQIQSSELQRYIEGRAKSVHGSGNSARCFYSKPKSTQGWRTEKFREAPREWMEAFWARARELLRQLEGAAVPLKRRPMRFSKAARALLQWYANKIEDELADGRRFALMRGAASKSAETCARLALAMAAFEGHAIVNVGVVRGAICIGAWHLNQFRNRFCPKSQLELDAMELEDCISRHAHKFKKTRSVPGPELCRLAPRRLRQVDALKATLRTLEEEGKLKVWDGHSWHVQLTWWFPPQEQPWQASGTSQAQGSSPFSRRWSQDSTPAATGEVPPPAGYELWPGVYLP